MDVERLQSETKVSYSDILEYARKAFKTEDQTFCGEMEYVLEDNSGILTVDRELETLNASPKDNPAGQYEEQFLRFYFVDYPEIQMNV